MQYVDHAVEADSRVFPDTCCCLTGCRRLVPYRALQVVADIVAGFPDDMVNRYSAYAYFPFQDQGRTPLWFEPYLQKAQRDNKRCVGAMLHGPVIL